MGQLTFQATLGGAVNLVGPNTASTTSFTLPSADGTNGQALTTNGSGTLAFATISAAPGGSTTQLQYNNAGAFAGSANMTFDGTSLTLPNDAFIGGYRVGAGVGGNNTVFTPNGSSTIITGTSYQNVAFGVYALSSQTATGYTNNTALGWAAMRYNTTGVNNVAVGFSALTSNTTANNNSAFGTYALTGNTTGTSNSAFGFQALYSNTTGTQNTCVGRGSGYGITTGSYNALFGVSASAGTTGEGNCAFGVYAALDSTTGYSNVSVGYEAGRTLTTGYENTLVGKGAGYPSAGNNITTGYRNTIVGQRAALSANSDFRSIVIGFEATGKGSQTAFIDCNGSVYQGNNSASWATVSDRRLKKNIVDNNSGLEKLTQIQVRNFEYRLPEEITEVPQNQAIQKTGVQLGVIAQELQAILPDCVKQESTGVLRVNTDNLTWYMINAIKELKAEFDAYKASHP